MRWHREETPKHQNNCRHNWEFPTTAKLWPTQNERNILIECQLLCSFKLNYIVLCQFQVYNMVVQHLNTWWKVHHESSNHLAACNVITVLLTIFLILYLMPLWHSFYNRETAPLNLIHLFHPSLHSPPLWQSQLFSGTVSVFPFCFAHWSIIYNRQDMEVT